MSEGTKFDPFSYISGLAFPLRYKNLGVHDANDRILDFEAKRGFMEYAVQKANQDHEIREQKVVDGFAELLLGDGTLKKIFPVTKIEDPAVDIIGPAYAPVVVTKSGKVKPLPGLKPGEEANITPPEKRCWECDHCLYVHATQRIMYAEANPPFSHANTADVEMWNRVLARSPCLRPKE